MKENPLNQGSNLSKVGGGAQNFSNSDFNSLSDFDKLIYQSYLLCFKEQHASVPQTLLELFNGEFKRDLESADFVQSKDRSILHMKYVILQSLRIAFHYSVESLVVMGETNLPSNEELEVI